MKTQPLLAFIAILFSTVSCSRSVPSGSTPFVMPSGDFTHILIHDNIERSYILHVPHGYDGTRPIAVVLAFHGGGGNAERVARLTAFNTQADQSGFLVVYPNGSGQLEDRRLTWNAGTCCGYAQANGIDDVGFVRAIIAELERFIAIDTKRIYATGISNGGIMSYRLACEASDLIAAIGPVAGTQNIVPCEPEEPVSVIHFHGTNDQHLPYAGGMGTDSLTGVDYASVEDSIQFWLSYNQCPTPSKVERFADIQHIVYTSCAEGSAVELYAIVGGGHIWPGGSDSAWLDEDQPTMTISATQIAWEFFAAHPKP